MQHLRLYMPRPDTGGSVYGIQQGESPAIEILYSAQEFVNTLHLRLYLRRNETTTVSLAGNLEGEPPHGTETNSEI